MWTSGFTEHPTWVETNYTKIMDGNFEFPIPTNVTTR